MKMGLKKLRDEIDLLDEELVSIIARRMSLMPKVARFKKKNKLEIFQIEREKELLKQKRQLATKFDLDVNMVESIFKKMMVTTKKIQSNMIK